MKPPPPDPLDAIWKALGDATRRAILDALYGGPLRTTEIVERFPHMTRHAVMKHIDVLRRAGLINTREEGRERINSLNAVPIRQIYERWVGKYSEFWAIPLLDIKAATEAPPPPPKKQPPAKPSKKSGRKP